MGSKVARAFAVVVLALVALGCGSGDERDAPGGAQSPVAEPNTDSAVESSSVEPETARAAGSPVVADSQWFDPGGAEVVVEEVCLTSEDDPHLEPGAVVCSDRGAIGVTNDHCGWDGTVFLSVEFEQVRVAGLPTYGRVYVRDDQHVPADAVMTTFGSGVTIPDDAVDTGYHTDDVGLWVSVADGEEAAYLVGTDGQAERWPEIVFGCA